MECAIISRAGQVLARGKLMLKQEVKTATWVQRVKSYLKTALLPGA